MKTTIIGFPRIGKDRELKTLIEAYFRKEKSEKEILEKIEALQYENYNVMKDYIDILPCNDFTYYDHMLDTMWLLGVIPNEYIENHLSDLEKYFAVARGYQSKNIDLKAFEMKKWFDTNYHYVVPRITDNLSLKLNIDLLINRIKIVKSLKKMFKVNLIGPFTFIKLSKIKSQNFHKIKEKIFENYIALIELIQNENPPFIQFEEPALVMDLTLDDIKLFEEFYFEILKYKNKSQFLLQTYFGDIRDIYEKILLMNFDGIGLDFVNGDTEILINKYGFDNKKILIAGIINGRNIWKSNYSQIFDVISNLLNYIPKEKIWLSTSCSLIHVPYSIENETKMDNEIKKRLAFAKEKLIELKEIKESYEMNKNPKESIFYKKNKEVMAESNFFTLESLNLNEDDFKRKLTYEERKKIQKETLKLPILPTTTIGSFPQTTELRKTRKLFKKGQIDKIQYESFIKKMIEEIIELQEQIGLDVLVHGEFERNDMVEYFAEFLTGITTTENGWVQSYGVRVTKPPIIYGDIKRKESITTKWISFAQSLTKKPVKGILTGPITIINWSFVREDIPLKNVAYQIALCLREEIDELQNNGIKIIQVDEAALREKLPLRKSKWNEYLDIAINSFKLATSTIYPEVQLHTHMCYSDFSDIIEYIEKMDVDVLTIEAAKSELSILEHIKNYAQKREIGPGVYDIHSPRIPNVEEIESLIKNILKYIPKENLWINPDCGLKTRNFEEIIQSLKNMVIARGRVVKNYMNKKWIYKNNI